MFQGNLRHINQTIDLGAFILHSNLSLSLAHLHTHALTPTLTNALTHSLTHALANYSQCTSLTQTAHSCMPSTLANIFSSLSLSLSLSQMSQRLLQKIRWLIETKQRMHQFTSKTVFWLIGLRVIQLLSSTSNSCDESSVAENFGFNLSMEIWDIMIFKAISEVKWTLMKAFKQQPNSPASPDAELSTVKRGNSNVCKTCDILLDNK